MSTTKLVKEHLKAIRRVAYKRSFKLEAWLGDAADDREQVLQDLAACYAKIEMANQLLDVIKMAKNFKEVE